MSSAMYLTRRRPNGRPLRATDAAARDLYTLGGGPGLRENSQPAFALAVQQQATIDVELSVGGVSTTVDVTGSAPLLNTTGATLGQLVENRFILNVPLVARNPLALVNLAAGLVPAENAAGGSTGINFVANGVRANTSDVLLDGINLTGIDQNGGITEVKYTPSVDLIGEIKIQTNFYSAEFGNSGGAIINMVSKSGTNHFHGVVYEFHRNAALNANSFSPIGPGRIFPTSRAMSLADPGWAGLPAESL